MCDDIVKNKKVFMFCFMLTIVAHGYLFFNFLCSHDSLFTIDSYTIIDHLIRLGRFVRPIFIKIFGNFETPVLIGFYQALFFSCAALFIIKLFKFKSPINAFLVCCILITNYSTTMLNATYLHDSAAYALAFLLSIAGVYYALKNNNISVYAILLYVLSLGIYQSYIQCSLVVLHLLFLNELLISKDDMNLLKKYLYKIVDIILAGVIYLVAHKIILKYLGLRESFEYNGMGNVLSFNLDMLIESINVLLLKDLEWLICPLNFHQRAIVSINVILLLFTLFAFYKEILKCKQKVIISTFAIITIPISMNISCILTKGMTHHLMTYSFFLLYLFPLTLINTKSSWLTNNNLKKLIIILVSIWSFDNIIYSNTIYLKKELENKATFAVINRMVDRIEQTDGYIPKITKVAIVGKLDNSNYNNRLPKIKYNGIGQNSSFATTYYQTYEKYLNTYLSSSVLMVSENEMELISKKQEVKEMPIFPNRNSCRNIDGIVVMKLSN